MDSPQVSAQMPVVQAQSPILGVPVDRPKPRVAYIWRTGVTFFLNKKEQIVADAYLETGSFAECARALRREGFRRDWLTCKRWLDLEHVKQYLMEKMEERGVCAGWSRERWILRMTRHMDGRERLASGDLYAMKLIGDVMGWKESMGVTFNQQINFCEKLA